MKTLINEKAIVSKDGKSVTITADIIEKDYPQWMVQRVTVGHLNPVNIAHPRHVQISGDAVFIKGGGTSVAFSNDGLVAIAAAIEPKTSFAPVIRKLTPENLTVQIDSELSPDFQWQISDDAFPKPKIPTPRPPSGTKLVAPPAVWANIEGQTVATLDPSKVTKGQWVRCVASSEAGSMTSNPVQIK